MKFSILLLLDFALINCDLISDIFSAEYRLFKTKYNASCIVRKDETSGLKIFIQNKALITKHNEKFYSGLETFSLELNQFFDSTNEEVNKMGNGFDIDNRRDNKKLSYFGIGDPEIHRFPPETKKPRAVNWIKRKAVNPVEGFTCCASDYASAALGALEAQLYFKIKSLKKFSVQNIVDCSRDFQSFGCEGGIITGSYKFIQSNNGLSYEKDYPYKASDKTCRQDTIKMNINLTEVIKISPDEEKQLEIVVGRKGPVAAAIDASSSLFHFYRSGIYNNTDCKYNYVNHAVLVVGYGKDKKTGLKYWLIKNNWGKDWGEGGYMRLLRNGNGECGITVTGYTVKLDPLRPL